MNILTVDVRPRTEPPLDSDLEDWARRFVLDPATDDRERRIVAQLLADVEAAR